MRLILLEGAAFDVVSEEARRAQHHCGSHTAASWIDDCRRARPSPRRARPPSKLRDSPLRSQPHGTRSSPPAIAGDPYGCQRRARGNPRAALPLVRGRRAPTRRLVVVGWVGGCRVERTPRPERDGPRGIHCPVIALGGCSPGPPVLSIRSSGAPRAHGPDTPMTHHRSGRPGLETGMPSDGQGDGQDSTGSEKRRVAPPVRLFPAEITPRCNSMIDRAMASPIPIPCGFVV